MEVLEPQTRLLHDLRTSSRGLSAREAQRRQAQYGPNELRRRGGVKWPRELGRQLTHPLALLLWLAALLSFVVGSQTVGIAVVLVILLNAAFSFVQELQAEQAVEALAGYMPQRVTVLRDGAPQVIEAVELVPGDIALLEEGERIAADMRLLSGAVEVDLSTLNGESAPALRSAELQDADVPRLAARDLVFSGTTCTGGEARAVVFATGMHTELGRIAALSERVKEQPSPLERQVRRVAWLIAAIAIAMAVAFVPIAIFAAGLSVKNSIVFAVGLLAGNVPEGLLPVITLALAVAVGALARKGALVKRLSAVETLGCTDVICTDKTGTLTENRMEAREVFFDGRRHLLREVDRGIAARHADFFACANFCHDVRESTTDAGVVRLGDPMEIALLKMHREIAGPSPASRRLDEIPFDSAVLRQTVVQETPDGAKLFCKGAPEAVLALCRIVFREGEARPLDQPTQAVIVQAQNAMAAQGLRVIAFASRDLPANWSHEGLENNLVFQGLVGLRDPPRPEVSRAMATCHEAGVKVIMVTGDHPNTAKAIAAEVGLLRDGEPTVITGEQLRTFSPVALGLALDARDVIFARVSAADKMRIVEALKSKGHIVAVTGDGANDAPALKAAHIGVAMGIAGTDVAKEAADMILLDDNFASIVNAVEEGRAVFQNIRKFLTYVLVHNVAELVPYLAFVLFTIPLALTPIQILLVDMGSDSLTGLGLGVEKPDPQGMRRPPRPQSEPLLTLPVGLRAYLFLGPIEAAAGMAAFFLVLLAGGWTYGHELAWTDPLYLRATTACLSGVIVMQIVNVFLCRSAMRSAFACRCSGIR